MGERTITSAKEGGRKTKTMGKNNRDRSQAPSMENRLPGREKTQTEAAGATKVKES